jgi:hypothetical protein
VVEEHDAGTRAGKQLADLFGLAAAEVQARVGPGTVAGDPAGDLQACGDAECGKLIERRFVAALAADGDADEQRRRGVLGEGGVFG